MFILIMKVGLVKVKVMCESEGHKVKVKVTEVVSVFSRFIYVFANSSYSFDRRVMKSHRNMHLDSLQEV